MGFCFRLGALGLAALALVVPERALACGGTFCDTGPPPNAPPDTPPMPIDQKGENILFVMEGGNVEAHIQIQYEGVAAKFAWVIPIPVVPEVEVGSQTLFRNLLRGSVPMFGFTSAQQICSGGGGPVCSGPCCGLGAGGSSANAGSGGVPGIGSRPPAAPDIVLREAVGAFDVTVLQGGTADTLADWLATNGYQPNDAALPIFDHYLSQSFVFVAIKLRGGVDVDEIHPLVIRYPGTEPCIPLRLTAIAATENMAVRAFFLGDDRIVPTNYRHVVPNAVRFDWLTQAANYDAVIAQAVDTATANGRAFVTEYAGPSAVIPSDGIFADSWNADAFQKLAPEEVGDVLTAQGLMQCSDTCGFSHPLLLPLLREHLPAPTEVSEDEFYSCISCYADRIDRKLWRSRRFAADLATRIVEPGRHARELLARLPYLTRLYTQISPVEMTDDPLFHARPDLPPIGNVLEADAYTLCSGTTQMTLPGGRVVSLNAFAPVWPRFSDAMPWAERVEEIPLAGPAIVLVDNTAAIDSLVGGVSASCHVPVAEGSGGSAGSAFGSSDSSVSGGGCACATVPSSRGKQAPLWLAAALGLIVATRLRRVRPRPLARSRAAVVRSRRVSSSAGTRCER